MEQQQHIAASLFISTEERAQLVRFCATTSGQLEAAEDLAQETLLEAWRHEQALRNPLRRSQWLRGIARNVCLRWQRRQFHEETHCYQGKDIYEQDEAEQLFIDDYNIELDLERKELLELLEHALALLPSQTRVALIQHYIEDSSLTEVAQQLGTNTNALAVRLQRGKLALRHILTGDMQQELAAHYLPAESATWEVTPLWCYRCGKQRLLGKRFSSEGKLLLRCPSCCTTEQQLLSRSELPLLRGMKNYKSMHRKLENWIHEHYRAALAAYFGNGTLMCETCKQPLMVLFAALEQLPDWLQVSLWDLQWSGDTRLVNTFCPYCQTLCNTSLFGLIRSLPEARAFTDGQPRIRTLPVQSLETEGRPALLIRLESVTENVALNVFSDEETFSVLRIEREGF